MPEFKREDKCDCGHPFGRHTAENKVGCLEKVVVRNKYGTDRLDWCMCMEFRRNFATIVREAITNEPQRS